MVLYLPGRLVTGRSLMKSSTSSDFKKYCPSGLALRVASRANRMLEPEQMTWSVWVCKTQTPSWSILQYKTHPCPLKHSIPSFPWCLLWSHWPDLLGWRPTPLSKQNRLSTLHHNSEPQCHGCNCKEQTIKDRKCDLGHFAVKENE